MIGRFIELRSAVFKSLIDLKSDIKFTKSDIAALEDIYATLHPVKTAVELLGSRDSTLLSAEATLNFLLNKLEEQKSALNNAFIQTLKTRIAERCSGVLYGLIQYLHNPAYLKKSNNDENSIFPKLSRNNIAKTLKELVDRLYEPNNVELGNESDSDAEVLHVPVSSEIDLKSQFKLAVKSVMEKPANTLDTKTLHTIINKEMFLFENGGNRGKYLEIVYQALLTIPPSSIEAERSFSAAGNVCTKLRTSLSDKKLDAICFLRAYLMNN